MTHKFGLVLVLVAATVSASAASSGTISGDVRNSSGVPQMGAAVEILATAAPQGLIVYTDPKGHYHAKGLLPGTYMVRVSAPAFLPSIRESIGLASGANLVINVTLNTLFEAIQLTPRRNRSGEDQDDWRWTLRSMANRPILRLADDGPLVVVRKSDNQKDGVLKARVAFLAGSDGETMGGGDMNTSFQLEQSVFGNGRWTLNGNLGYGSPVDAPIVLRGSFSREFSNGSRPEFAFTAKRFASPELAARHAALQALAMSMADSTVIAEKIGVRYGAEIQTIQFAGRATAFRPFGGVDYHVGKNTVVEYKYTTSVPNMRKAKGFDTAPADLSESGPRFSLRNGMPALEAARHHEVAFSQRLGKNKVQVAYFKDRVRNSMLTGVGGDISPEIVPDVYSGTFLLGGGDYSTSGMRAVYQRDLFAGTTATIDYSFGGVVTAPEQETALSDVRSNLAISKQNSVALKFDGTLPGWKTRVLTSYRWTGADGLTPVDMFNSGPGQSDPYLSLFLRQPLPRKLIPCGMEALVDVRNLLAQGYRPVLSNDGQVIYLVQAARSVRGGVSFTF
jgi:hypothetical protein